MLFLVEKNSSSFNDYCVKNKISKPAYLSISPEKYKKFSDTNSINFDDIRKYQGSLIDVEDLKDISEKKSFFLSSHLYEHFNSLALTNENFIKLIDENEKYLSNFKNNLKSFAFTNGQPGSCFSKSHVEILKNMNFDIIFSASNSTYNNGFLYDRIILTNHDNNEEKINYKILMSFFKKFFYKKKLGL